MSEQIDGVDFALAAYREEGVWQVQSSRTTSSATSTRLAGALRRFPGDGGALGLVAIDEDFFVIVRVAGPSARILLSDITAADGVGARPLGGRATSACPSPRTRTSRRRPATSTSSATSAWAPWTWACCSTTSTSTPTRCSPTSPAGSASARSSTRPSASPPPEPAADADAAWTTPRCAPPSTRRARALATGDVPIGAVVLDADRRGGRPRAQRPRGATATRPATPRWSPCARPRPRVGRVAARPAAPWWSPSSRARCAPARSCSSRVDRLVFGGVRRQGRRGRIAVGRGPRPPAQPPARGGRRRARRGVLGPAGRFLRPPTPRVASPAVACPSGLRRTPRKRLWAQVHRGFKSHRHRHAEIPVLPTRPLRDGCRDLARPAPVRR